MGRSFPTLRVEERSPISLLLNRSSKQAALFSFYCAEHHAAGFIVRNEYYLLFFWRPLPQVTGKTPSSFFGEA